MRRIIAIAAVFLLLAAEGDLCAQGVQGFVVQGAGQVKTPVPGAQVRLLRGQTLIAEATADSVGWFLLRAPKGGDHRMEVTHLSFDPLLADVSLDRGRIVDVLLQLGERPLELPALLVRGKRDDVRQRATYAGMVARSEAARSRRSGTLGTAVTLRRGDPEWESSSSISHLSDWFPAGRCHAAFFLNGMPSLGAALVSLPLAHLEAVEFFRDALSAPREFRSFAEVQVPPVEPLFSAGSAMWGETQRLRGTGMGTARTGNGTRACQGIIAVWTRQAGT